MWPRAGNGELVLCTISAFCTAGDVSIAWCEELPQNPFNKSTMKQPATVRVGRSQSFQDHHAASSLELHPPLGSSQPYNKIFEGK